MARDDGVSNARPLRRPPTIRIDHGFRGGRRGPPAPFGGPFLGGGRPPARSDRAAVRLCRPRRGRSSAADLRHALLCAAVLI